MKLREEFYELFKNTSKSDIEKAISLLSESDKDLLIYLWGQDKKQRKMNTKQVEDLIIEIEKLIKIIKKEYPNLVDIPKNYDLQKIVHIKGSALRSLLLFFECNYWRGGDGLYSVFFCVSDSSCVSPPL